MDERMSVWLREIWQQVRCRTCSIQYLTTWLHRFKTLICRSQPCNLRRSKDHTIYKLFQGRIPDCTERFLSTRGSQLVWLGVFHGSRELVVTGHQ
jgi:hypothetical protein